MIAGLSAACCCCLLARLQRAAPGLQPGADTWLYWWLDGYVDFNGEQAPQRARRARRAGSPGTARTQLPDYADLLARAQRRCCSRPRRRRCAAGSTSCARASMRRYEHGVPAPPRLLLTLTPAQLQHIERRYAKANEEFRDDFLQAQPERAPRGSRSSARVERAETLYGQLDDAQRSVVAAGVAASPFDAERWLAERQRRQRDILETLRG